MFDINKQKEILLKLGISEEVFFRMLSTTEVFELIDSDPEILKNGKVKV